MMVWPIIRGVAGAKGFPVMVMNHYSRGTLLVLAIPENVWDLYSLPRGLLTKIRAYLMPDFPVRIGCPFTLWRCLLRQQHFRGESFRADQSSVEISAPGANLKLRDLSTGESLAAQAEPAAPKSSGEPSAGPARAPRSTFKVSISAHSFRAFGLEK